MTFRCPEKHRVEIRGFPPGDETCGTFMFKGNIFAIASAAYGWEHVSVSIRNAQRCPTWVEMCFVKEQFWEPEDCVVQFHPPQSEYVNNHPYCLHLWRQIGSEYQTPPRLLVGI